MITITFTPHTAEQGSVLAEAIQAYLVASQSAQQPAAEAEAEPAPTSVAPAKKRKPAVAEVVAPVAGPTETTAPTPIVNAAEIEALNAPRGVTLEEVRLVLATLSQEGKGQAVRALIAEFGVANLTAVPKDQLLALMTKAQAL